MTKRLAVLAAVPAPDAAFGFAAGTRPARYEADVAYLRLLAEESDRVPLEEYGVTAEGRTARATPAPSHDLSP